MSTNNFTQEQKEELVTSIRKESEDILNFYIANKHLLVTPITYGDFLQYLQESIQDNFPLSITQSYIFPTLQIPGEGVSDKDIIPDEKDVLIGRYILEWWKKLGIPRNLLFGSIIQKIRICAERRGYLLTIYVMQEVQKIPWQERFPIDQEELQQEMLDTFQEKFDYYSNNPMFDILESQLNWDQKISRSIKPLSIEQITKFIDNIEFNDSFNKDDIDDTKMLWYITLKKINNHRLSREEKQFLMHGNQERKWQERTQEWQASRKPSRYPYSNDEKKNFTLNNLGMSIVKRLIEGYPLWCILLAYLGNENQVTNEECCKAILTDDYSIFEGKNIYLERGNRFFKWCEDVGLDPEKNMSLAYIDKFIWTCETVGKDLAYETFDRIGALCHIETIIDNKATCEFPGMVYEFMPDEALQIAFPDSYSKNDLDFFLDFD